MMETVETLRKLKVLEGPFPIFEIQNAPVTPHELFLAWLNEAIDVGVAEPHAMTLSTVDSNGEPDARTLILKNMDHNGWYFASSSDSKKGKQLKTHAKAALTFYWYLVGRQVRIRGSVTEMSSELSAKDFLSRNEIARATALTGKQSSALSSLKELELTIAKKQEEIMIEPNLVYPHWTLYRVDAKEVEFWQGDKDRKHIRLLYQLHKDGWIRQLLWP